MDEKRQRSGLAEPGMGRRPRAASGMCCRRRVRQRLAYIAALGIFGLMVFTFLRHKPLPPVEMSTWRPAASGAGAGAETEAGTASHLVPLEMHIMSKCPDALDCLRDLVMPTMQQVSDKVNFTTSFIGRPTRDGGVDCMHGPAECMGDILELCANKLYADPKIHLGFTWCLMRNFERIPDRDLVEDCALEHAVDVGLLDECATRDDGQYAMNLLADSVRHTADVGVTKSCTVRLDNQIYCIRDGGEWTDCPTGPSAHDLIISVEKLYRQP